MTDISVCDVSGCSRDKLSQTGPGQEESAFKHCLAHVLQHICFSFWRSNTYPPARGRWQYHKPTMEACYKSLHMSNAKANMLQNWKWALNTYCLSAPPPTQHSASTNCLIPHRKIKITSITKIIAHQLSTKLGEVAPLSYQLIHRGTIYKCLLCPRLELFHLYSRWENCFLKRKYCGSVH